MQPQLARSAGFGKGRVRQTALLQAVRTLTHDPLQRLLLVTDGTVTEILEASAEVAGPSAAYFGLGESTTLVSRTYRVIADRQPIMVITEKFPERKFGN